MLLLQWTSAILALANKFLINAWLYKFSRLLINKFPKKYTTKSFGWLLGITSSIFGVTFLLLRPENFKIFVANNFAMITLMLYAYSVARTKEEHHSKWKNKLKEWDLKIKIFLIAITITISLFLMLKEESNPIIKAQFYAAAAGLIGTLFLSFHKQKETSIGWALYFVSHTVAAYVFFKRDIPVIAGFQTFSALVAIGGIFHQETKGDTPLD